MPRSWIRFGVVAGAAAIVAVVGFGVSAAKRDERVQHLTGAYARAHVAKKEAKDDKYKHLRKQAQERFAEMGVAPTGEILVVRRDTFRKSNFVAALAEKLVPALLAGEHWQGGGEEVIFESYYSGSNTQWLGWAYHQALSDGWWMAGDVRVDFAPSLNNPGADPYIAWIGWVDNETDREPRFSMMRNPAGWLVERLCPTLLAQDCGASRKSIFRSFIRAGFARMRYDNSTNWLASLFAGAAGGPAGFAISSLGLFGVSYGVGYMDAMWNYTRKCPGWYW